MIMIIFAPKLLAPSQAAPRRGVEGAKVLPLGCREDGLRRRGIHEIWRDKVRFSYPRNTPSSTLSTSEVCSLHHLPDIVNQILSHNISHRETNAR